MKRRLYVPDPLIERTRRLTNTAGFPTVLWTEMDENADIEGMALRLAGRSRLRRPATIDAPNERLRDYLAGHIHIDTPLCVPARQRQHR